MRIRKLYFLFFLWSAVLTASAQQDSVKNILQQRQLFFTDSIKINLYLFAVNNPLFTSSLLPDQSSRITLGQQVERGKFVEAQGSTQTSTTFLNSDGVTMLGSIKLYGAFSYQKVFEDSTHFAHQTRNNTTTPYYYGSPANNHYERSVYRFKAFGIKELFNNKVTTGIGLAYTIGNHFSTNDPRGSLKEYQFDMNANIGYNFNSDLKLGLGYTYGYGQETVNIGYKNRAYYESISYPAYVNYLINGYGEPNPKTSNRIYNDVQDRSGFNFAVTFANTPAGSFYLSGKQLSENQQYDFRNNGGISKLATYRLNKHDIAAIWTKNVKPGTLSTQIQYQNLSGRDFNLTYLANNYLFTAHQLGLKLLFGTLHKQTRYNYNFGLNQQDEERIDGITGNQVYFNRIQINAGFGIHQQLNTAHAAGIHLGVHYGTPLNDELNISQANESYFTREVIYHNYLYHTARSLGAELSSDYSFPFFGLMQGNVRLNLFYTHNIQIKELNRTLTSIPGNDRLFSNLSFNLYF